ncbi:MAG: TIGR00730 family Rossman fold protein [Desulfobacterales bacterium]
MPYKPIYQRVFPTAMEDAHAAKLHVDSPQCRSASYRLAFLDDKLMLRDELRPVRLQLELLKAELVQHEMGIASTVVIFGSARIPNSETAEAELASVNARMRGRENDPEMQKALRRAQRDLERSRYTEEARRLSALISLNSPRDRLVVVTGGGGGIMEAANRGAHESGCLSIGLNIVLPFEQAPNAYVTPELSFQFHYFAIRKMHFLLRARSLVVFPGGYGTLDELFETLTLIQTGKIKPIPVLLFGRSFWEKIINFDALVEEGNINPEDVDIFTYVETAEQAWEIISRFEGLA